MDFILPIIFVYLATFFANVPEPVMINFFMVRQLSTCKVRTRTKVTSERVVFGMLNHSVLMQSFFVNSRIIAKFAKVFAFTFMNTFDMS